MPFLAFVVFERAENLASLVGGKFLGKLRLWRLAPGCNREFIPGLRASGR